MTTPLSSLLHDLRSGNPTAPRLTWYGPDAERVELSGKVLDNWVAKTSNLLQDELDAEPGMRIRLDLAPHWKSLVWALAAWQLGLETVLAGSDADFLVTAATDQPAGEYDAVIAVALPALAMRWAGNLPAGWVDYAADVRSHGDFFMAHDEPATSATAVTAADGTVFTQQDLMTNFAVPQANSARIHVAASSGLEAALADALGAWHSDGSIVLTHQSVELTEHLKATERISGN